MLGTHGGRLAGCVATEQLVNSLLRLAKGCSVPVVGAARCP